MARTRAQVQQVETLEDLVPRNVKISGPNRKGPRVMLPIPTTNSVDCVKLDTIPSFKDKFYKNFNRDYFGMRW